ncbi:MAG: S1 family serine peptidase [Geminicoccaceae bacterium]
MSEIKATSEGKRHSWRKCLKLAFCGLIVPIALSAPRPALSQERSPNWAESFVNARVTARNFQAIGTGDRRMRMAQIRGSIEGRIVGGTDAADDENPFQVALLLRDQANNQNAQFCGGTLVAGNMVVTAAHCSDFLEAGDVQVLTGARRLDAGGTRRDVSRITIHPDWDSVTFDNDVAVWELSSHATDVPFAELATTDGPVGSDVLVTGWGALAEGGASPTQLQAVEVPIVSRDNCNDANSYNGDITANMICAGLDQGGQDSCQGDSGGPLTAGSGNGVLTGVVSWGEGCARPNLFGVYARVSSPGIRSFLDEAIGTELAEDCVGFNNANLAVEQINGDVKIVDGSHWLLSFGSSQGEAEQTLDVLKSYRSSQLCFVGRPNPELTYVLADNTPPSGALAGEDCLAHDLARLEILDEGSRFILTDGRSRMIAFDRRVEAETAISLMQAKGFTRVCYVGRPGPSFIYMRQ